MKSGIKICKLRNGKYIAKKKGWFGYKKFIEVYDGNFMSHFTWSYSAYAQEYDTIKELLKEMEFTFHERRSHREVCCR